MTWISSLHLNYLTCQCAELYAFHENDTQCIVFTAYFWLPASHGVSMYAQWLSLCLSVWFSPRLRLSLGTATPVDERCRTGAAAPGGSCWVTLTHSSRHAHTHTRTICKTWKESWWTSDLFVFYLYGLAVIVQHLCWCFSESYVHKYRTALSCFFFLTWIWWSDIKFNTVPIYNTVYETTAVTVFSVSMEFPLTLPVNGCYSQLYLANMAVAHLIFL